MKPTPKSPEISDFINSFLLPGMSREEHIGEGLCATCPDSFGLTESSFRDDLSVKEYQISGMCQKCQDSVFGA
jgi:hypothetical protein